MKTKLYRKVYVPDRLPDTHFESYSTDKGLMFDHQLVDNGAEWWLEEVELPSEEAMNKFKPLEDHTEVGLYDSGFYNGASFILNHIKGCDNE